MSENNIYNDAVQRLYKIAKIANISNDVLNILSQPKSVLEVSVPVKMDNGGLEVFKGYRVRHNDAKGPTKGGIRFHPNVSREEVMTLAFWMSLKCALVGIPYGGGKGGIIVNPKELSTRELENLSRGYISAVADFIGPDTDIPAPDVYTNPTIMNWMMDEYNKITRSHTPAVITGKPVANGGSLGRDDATGRGAYYCIKELEKLKSWNPKKTTIAIQGFGNAAIHIANLLYKDGYKIVAISDSKNAVYSSEGLNIDKFIKTKSKTGRLVSEEKENSYDLISNDDLLELDVDILVPAALENQITSHNADRIKANYIVELANGPIDPSVDDIINDKEITVIPDILANAGGVIVSYFEWVQNRQGYYWEEAEVHTRLRSIISNAFHNVYKLSKAYEFDSRTSAYIVALHEIEYAISGNQCEINPEFYIHNNFKESENLGVSIESSS